MIWAPPHSEDFSILGVENYFNNSLMCMKSIWDGWAGEGEPTNSVDINFQQAHEMATVYHTYYTL